MAKKKPVEWKGDGRVQTDGTNWEVRVRTSEYVHYNSLKDHIVRMNEVLAKHPDAMVLLDKDWDYGGDEKEFIIQWWEPATADHKEVVLYLKRKEGEEILKKEQEERNIAALRKARPELFKES